MYLPPSIRGRWSAALAAATLALGAAQHARAEGGPKRDRARSDTSADAPQEQATFQKVLNQALAEFDLGHWEEAKSLFEQAHELQPSARTLRAIGLCAFEARSYVEAVSFLSLSLSDPRKPLTGKQRANLVEVLARAKEFIAQYKLQIEPAAATVLVDMASPVIVDGKVLLDPGLHTLLVKAEGFQDAQHQIQAKSREDRELRIELARLALGPVDSAGVDSASQPKHVSKAAADRTDPSVGSRRWYKSPWLWTAVGVLVVGGAAAGTLVALNRSEDNPAAYGGTTDRFLSGP